MRLPLASITLILLAAQPLSAVGVLDDDGGEPGDAGDFPAEPREQLNSHWTGSLRTGDIADFFQVVPAPSSVVKVTAQGTRTIHVSLLGGDGTVLSDSVALADVPLTLETIMVATQPLIIGIEPAERPSDIDYTISVESHVYRYSDEIIVVDARAAAVHARVEGLGYARIEATYAASSQRTLQAVSVASYAVFAADQSCLSRAVASTSAGALGESIVWARGGAESHVDVSVETRSTASLESFRITDDNGPVEMSLGAAVKGGVRMAIRAIGDSPVIVQAPVGSSGGFAAASDFEGGLGAGTSVASAARDGARTFNLSASVGLVYLDARDSPEVLPTTVTLQRQGGPVQHVTRADFLQAYGPSISGPTGADLRPGEYRATLESATGIDFDRDRAIWAEFPLDQEC